MISSVMSSLSWSSTAQQKYRLAYLQHIKTTLSRQLHLCIFVKNAAKVLFLTLPLLGAAVYFVQGIHIKGSSWIRPKPAAAVAPYPNNP